MREDHLRRFWCQELKHELRCKKSCFLDFRLIKWRYCCVYIVKTLILILIAAKTVMICLFVCKTGLLMTQLIIYVN